MGAVHFSIPADLLLALRTALGTEVFVETGTFRGDSLAVAAGLFSELHSVELSPVHHADAVARFAGQPHVRISLGDSPGFLKALPEPVRGKATLYFLDAHWCVATGTAGQHSQCPLLRELDSIGPLGPTSAILIDDARLFLATPPEPHEGEHWPSFDEIVRRLRRLSDSHELMVVNDIIVFHPPTASAALKAYARSRGVDWLRAAQSLEENTDLRAAMEEKELEIGALSQAAAGYQDQLRRFAHEMEQKEAVIRTLQAAVENATSQHAMLIAAMKERELVGGGPTQVAMFVKGLEEKEAVIQELRRALDSYRAAFSLLRLFTFPFRPLFGLAAKMSSGPLGSVFAPRLGTLSQYPPRAMVLPARYASAVPPPAAPRISIVTPSYQQGAFIERTIRSVLEQGYPDLEYFVQDGASTDGTVEVLRRYADRLAGWDSSPDSGQTQAINRAFARVHGEIMAWLNSDDILLPGALAAVADFFSRHPEVDVVYGHRILIDEGDREIGRWMLPEHDGNILSWADYVPQETLFWRRRIWDKVGGQLDESFRFAMDWDLLVRFRDAGARFARLPRFLGGFRIHPHQKTSAAISEVGFQEMDRIRQRVLGRVPTGTEVRKAVLPYLLKHLFVDLGWRLQSRMGFNA